MQFASKYKILSWVPLIDQFYDGKQPAPVTIDLEPENNCNLACDWCYPMLTGWREEFKGRMPRNMLLSLPKFFSEWGSKTITVTGGGEPMIHPDIVDFFTTAYETDLRLGIITNGAPLTKNKFDAINSNQIDWIGFSIDAGTADTYIGQKRVDSFDKVIQNAGYIAKHFTGLFTYKFLITPETYADIYVATKLAKDTGFDNIYFRPVIGTEAVFTEIQKVECRGFLEMAKQLEDDSFSVYVNYEKTDEDLVHRKAPVCLATPVLLTICANGKAYWCQDHRGEDHWEIADLNNGFDELRKNWGGPAHLKKIQEIKPDHDCNRCTFNAYNELLHNRDKLCLDYL